MINVIERLEELKIAVVCIREDVDTSTIQGRLLRSLLLSISQFERELIAERISAGRQRSLEEGTWIFGPRSFPYGLNWNYGKAKFEKVPREIAAVNRILELLTVEGKSLRGIVETMEAEGWPTRRQGKWSRKLITKIITDPIYSGKREFDDGKITIKTPVIIPLKVQEKAIEILKKRAVQVSRAGTHFLLSGILHCEACGGKMNTKTGPNIDNTVYRYYACPTKGCIGWTRSELLDDLMWDGLKRDLLVLVEPDPVDPAEIIRKERELKEVEQEINQTQQEITKLLDLRTGQRELQKAIRGKGEKLGERLSKLNERKVRIGKDIRALKEMEEDQRLFKKRKRELQRLVWKTMGVGGIKMGIDQRKEFLRVIYDGPLFLRKKEGFLGVFKAPMRIQAGIMMLRKIAQENQ
jgi:hypothetical protein